LALLVVASAPVHAAAFKVFADGFETGDVWAWSGPRVASVAPAFLTSNNSTSGVDVAGSGFGTAAPSVEFVCRDGLGTLSSYGVAVETHSDSALGLTIDTLGISQGSVCRLRVVAANGSWDDFPGIPVRGSAQAIGEFAAATDMHSARRRLVLLDSPRRSTSAWIYAIGGDDGTDSGVLDTADFATADEFGQLSAWSELPLALTAARAGAGGARLGRFLYVVGGSDGTDPTSTVQRAQILDPADAPYLVSETVDQDPSPGGLAAGWWVYRVAATFDSSDGSNPDGESLAGPAQSVVVPAFGNGGRVTLDWSVVPGAAGYRVYRSPNVGDPASAVRLVGTATTPPFVDTGAVAGTEAPLPLGALGRWRALASLNTGRVDLAVVAAPDPSDATHWYIYAIGGRDGAGDALGSYEFLAVTITADGSQTTAISWTAGAYALANARARLGAWTYESGGNTYIFAGPGEGVIGVGVNDIDRGLVAPGGDLGSWSSQANHLAIFKAGYAPMNDGLGICVAGGGATASTGISKSILGGSPPVTGTWQSSGSLLSARVGAATKNVNGRIFVAGGSNGAVTLKSVESASN